MLTQQDIIKLKKEFKKDFTTKEDLDNLKKEFKKGFATKDDLKRFATKDDLKRFATKDDLQELRQEMNEKLDIIINYTKTTADELVITRSKVTNHEGRITKIESHLSLSN